MSDDTFSGSDFSAAASTSSEAVSAPATEETTAPVTTDTTDPAATVQADATATVEPPVGDTKPVPGVPPEKHWPTILENARTKAKEEALAEYRAKVGWAEQVDRSHIEQMAQMGQLYATDRAAFTRQYFAEALADPELAPVIRSEAARILGQRTTPAEPEPIPILNDKNEVVGTLQDVVERMLSERLTPFEQDLQTRQQREQAAEDARQQDALVQQETESIRQSVFTLPEFEPHKAEILAKAKDFLKADSRVSVEAAMHRAYAAIVIPMLAKSERAKVFNDLTKKPAASSVSPSSGTTAIPKPDSDKDWTELFAEKASALGLV